MNDEEKKLEKRRKYTREWMRAWRAANPEKAKEQARRNGKAYYEKNKEKIAKDQKVYQKEYRARGDNAQKLRDYQKQYRKDNPEKVAARHKLYAKKNKEKIRKRAKLYQEANKEKIAAKRKIYQKENAKEIKARKKKYQIANKDKIQAKARAHYREVVKPRLESLSPKDRAEYNKKIRISQDKWRRDNRERWLELACRAANKRRAIKINAVLPTTDFDEINKFFDERDRLAKKYGVKYEVDHIIPLSIGGAHHQDNLRVITESENRKKLAKYVPELGGVWANNDLAEETKKKLNIIP